MTPPHVHDKGSQAKLLSSVLWMVSSFARKDLSKFYTGFLPIGSGMQSQRWNLSQETRMFWLLLNEDLSPWTCDLVVLQYVLEVDICAWSWGRSEEEKTTTIHFFENWSKNSSHRKHSSLRFFFNDQERQTSYCNAAFYSLPNHGSQRFWSNYTLSYIESFTLLVKLRHRLSFVEFSSNIMIVIVNYQFCFINFEVHFFQTLLKLKTEYRKQQHCKNKLQGEIDN